MPVIYNNRPILTLQPNTAKQNVDQNQGTQSGDKFSDVLAKKIDDRQGVKISKHAEERLLKRNIMLNPNDLKEIGKVLDKAATKGIKDALIIMGDTALVANVKNRTIITAATGEDLKDNIFTNIDGAIIM